MPITFAESFDPLVVLTRDFAPYLERYIYEYDRDVDVAGNKLNENMYGVNNSVTIPRAGAITVLSAQTGVTVRRIYAIRNKEAVTLKFSIFDRLIAAMGMPQWATEIPVYKHSKWTAKKFLDWLAEQDLTLEDINAHVDIPV